MDGGEAAWFAGDRPANRIRDGRADAPADWPALAVETGFAAEEADYEAALHEATTTAAREAVRERERADDAQLIHAVRAMDDTRRVANELAERVAEWGGSLFAIDDASSEGSGASASDADGALADARRIARRDPETAVERRVVSLAERAAATADEAEELARYVERVAPRTAPNLAALAGPTLAARLIALAGGLESLAKRPSGTVQVLGAEEALFAHLRGHAPSPKHGVIFTHPYVRETRPEDRGSAARALAGKLAIAARVDHYAGDRRPELDRELDERIARIRARAEDDASGTSASEAGASGTSDGEGDE
ncbi:MAG: NOP5/NOP56 family protein [Halobaculum sp.]